MSIASICDSDDDFAKPGKLIQILIAVFVGIPLSMALVVGLTGYFVFQYTLFTLFPNSKLPKIKFSQLNRSQRGDSDARFTSSLTSMANIHKPAVSVDKNSEAPAEAQTSEAAQHQVK